MNKIRKIKKRNHKKIYNTWKERKEWENCIAAPLELFLAFGIPEQDLIKQ